MFRPLIRSHRRPPRRGTAILITCFFLITIMMVTGLALVMYAAREKAAALAYQDAAAIPTRAAPDPTLVVNQFLGTLLYDTDDDGAALHNTLRGHSIGRSMYGSNPTGQPNWTGSTTPWAGVGLFHEATGGVGGYTYNGTVNYPSLAGIDRSRIVNHTGLRMDDQFLLIDPEWTRNRLPNSSGSLLFKDTRAGSHYVGKHAGYTYPDRKNFFLGARDPHTGEVLVQSFHREGVFGTLAPNNPNWSNDVGRLLTLRPRPGSVAVPEHPNFPRVPPNADGSYTGDVQNAPGSYRFVAGKGFIAINDSLWMHIGLPPMQLADGRRVQPLVAPLILPLDGAFDLSSHGNRLGASATHRSHGGYGSWEVNINPGIIDTPNTNTETERQGLINQRVHNPSRSAMFNSFANGQLLPQYAPVAWDGRAVQFQLPTGNSLLGLPSSGNPSFSPAFGDFQSNNALVGDHPAAFNRDEFGPRNDTSVPPSPVYPYTDLKRLSLRYAFTPDWYYQAFVTKSASGTFLGTPSGAPVSYPYYANPTASMQSNYRLDPAHTRRLLFGPKTTALERPALSPTFVGRNGTTALQMVATASPVGALARPGALTTSAYPAPQTPGGVTDFAADVTVPNGAGSATVHQWYNVQAAIGSVNLNRPLADYRVDTTRALAEFLVPAAAVPPPEASSYNVTVASIDTANADRRALAKDIFARLIVALGAAGEVYFDNVGVQIKLPDPTTYVLTLRSGATETYTLPQYNALRHLAQLAVNIVDYVDNDDVSTVFEWNAPTAVNYADPVDVGNRVVFGFERPRLVFNEAHGEIANGTGMRDGVTDPDPDTTKPDRPLQADAQAHVKFWVELVNPTSAPHSAATGVLGTGAVNLSAYRVEIARQQRGTTAKDQLPALADQSSDEFQANSSGRFVEGADAKFTFPLVPRNKFGVPTEKEPGAVAPNVGQYGPAFTSTNTTLPGNGFLLVGPEVNAKTPPMPTIPLAEFNPGTAGAWAQRITSPAADMNKFGLSTAMGYTVDMPAAADLSSSEFRRHTLLLRRAANPYLKPNDPIDTATFDSTAPVNPYVTVDMMNEVPAFDAVHRAKGEATNRGSRAMAGGPGYDPPSQRFSVGRVQPYAGRTKATVVATPGNYNTYAFADSMVLAQTAAGTLPPGDPMDTKTQPNEPKNTFGRHNGKDLTLPSDSVQNSTTAVASFKDPTQTLMAPFDWLQHLDRPLESAGDLFLVREGRPHAFTHEFVANSATGLVYDRGYAQWAQHNNGLARALELLTVKSPAVGVPHGGRVNGKINPNAMQDRRVAQGVWDAPAAITTGNRFDQTFVDSFVWGRWMQSRSPLQAKVREDGSTTINVPVPGTSVNDVASGGVDRPFMPFAAPAVPAGVPGTFAYTTPSAASDGDTFLRRDTTAGATLPTLFQPAETHLYTQSEPMRKVMNNLTTVSHSFVVYLTIGYFEVEGSPTPPAWPTSSIAPPPRFGIEVYDQIPGDMRQKFMAVIDMSNMAMHPVNAAHAASQPFFTALTATARPTTPVTTPVVLTLASGGGDGSNFSIPVDGQTVVFPGNNTQQLVLGYGAEAQLVTVDAVGPRAAGGNYPTGLTVNQIGVTNLTRTAWGGTCVSNVRPGYVGPQPGFNFNSATYKPVVPYVERLR